MSVGFNNTNYNINTGAVGSPGQSVNSSPISGSGSNAAIDMVDVEKQKLLKRLNITSDEYAVIVENNSNFPTLDEAKQLEIVNQYKAKQISYSAETTTDTDVQTSSSKFDKAAYNSMNKEEKFTQLKYEFARNIFIYGIKDRDGNIVGSLTSHSPEEWDEKMSDEQKQQFITELMNAMKNDPKLQDIGKSFNQFVKGLSEEQQVGLIDSTMRAVQVADSQGLSFLEFVGLDEYEKMDATEEYLAEDPDNLNDSDKRYLEINGFIKTEMIKSLKDRGVGLPENPSMSEVAKYAKYCNLDPTEEALRKLKAKKEQSGLDPKEEKYYQELLKFDSGNGKNIINEAKAAKLLDLENEFNQLNQKLESGQLLSAEEQEKYNLIKNYLDSDDAKYLKEKVIPNMRQPETDYEKSVYDDIKEFKTAINGYLNDNTLISAAAIKYIESKTAGLSPEEKEKYINSFLTFNRDTSSVPILKHFGKEFKNLYGNEDLVSVSAATVDSETGTEQLNALYGTMNNSAKTGNDYQRNMVLDAAGYVSDVYKTGGTDEQKMLVSEGNVDLAGLNVFGQNETDQLMFDAVDINISMKDDANQLRAQTRIQQSPAFNTSVRNYTTDHIGEFHTENQLPVYEAAITGDKDAAAHASENGSVSSMASENQNDAFDLLYNRLNEYFEGDDAIKYLNNLSDQIQNCDKNNQLDMHNRMMGSQYSEVQQHTAGNIGNYDPSVQADALDSVYATGNENAIESAVESIVNSPSSDVVQQVLPRVITEAAKDNSFIIQTDNNDNSTVDSSALQQKILSGAKLTPQEYASLSSSQKKEYFSNYFKKLPLEQKIKMLSSLPNGTLKKSVYTAIARLDSNLFTAIVKDKDRAEMLLGMGLPEDINQKIDKIVNFLAVSDIGYRNIAEKYDITDGEDNSKGKSYATNPDGLDYKDILKKDKYGNILA